MKKRKILSLLLSLVMLIALCPALLPSASAAGPYQLWVQDVQVTDANKGDVLNDGGSVVFDPGTSTLTLFSADITGAESPILNNIYCGIFSYLPALTLELVGPSTITCEKDGVHNQGIYAQDLTIRRKDNLSGELTVTASAGDYSCYGVYASDTFTMLSGTVVAEAKGGDKDNSIGIWAKSAETAKP